MVEGWLDERQVSGRASGLYGSPEQQNMWIGARLPLVGHASLAFQIQARPCVKTLPVNKDSRYRVALSLVNLSIEKYSPAK